MTYYVRPYIFMHDLSENLHSPCFKATAPPYLTKSFSKGLRYNTVIMLTIFSVRFPENRIF